MASIEFSKLSVTIKSLRIPASTPAPPGGPSRDRSPVLCILSPRPCVNVTGSLLGLSGAGVEAC